ncbi:probable receptor-like protein kinase At1g30570 [Fagus crenata]
MKKSISASHKWHRSEISNPISIIYIFILITLLKLVVSQLPMTDCSLDIKFLSNPDCSGCEGGDWGGFLHTNNCGVAFDAYLYALGRRANQTGQIFINFSEQRNCLNSMKIIQPDIFGCGIEKLTRGADGCSDFSVEDVTMLVTLTGSGLEDEEHLHALYRCLGEQNITETQAPQAPEGKRKTKISTGIWILVGFGSIVVIVVIVAIAENISPKRCPKSTPLKKKDAFKDMFPKNPACPKVPIKEVYSATDNLSELNFIGEGITGKVYKGILSNKQHVAIKHIINDGNVESFVREVTSSSHVRHPNLVALLGCCVMEDECFLVYEFCPNGNLSEWLFGKDKVLTWIQRLEIAIDSARCLWFLHTYPEGCFVHHDIKAKVHSRSGSIAEFSNTKLDGEYSTEAFDLILQLAVSCTSLKKQRQSMEQVAERLEEALDISTRAKACTPQTMPEQSFTS